VRWDSKLRLKHRAMCLPLWPRSRAPLIIAASDVNSDTEVWSGGNVASPA